MISISITITVRILTVVLLLVYYDYYDSYDYYFYLVLLLLLRFLTITINAFYFHVLALKPSLVLETWARHVAPESRGGGKRTCRWQGETESPRGGALGGGGGSDRIRVGPFSFKFDICHLEMQS